jgi:hypothetical protein
MTRRPDEIDAYLEAAGSRLDEQLGNHLTGAYVGGSLALGDFDRSRSDIDLAAVTCRPLTDEDKRALVAALRQEALPCPARGLELVVYPIRTALTPTIEPGFELNLNTGADLTFRADFDPEIQDSHWFAIDRSILARHGVALAGPPAGEVFAPIPRSMLLPVVAESVRWHATSGERVSTQAILNACRAFRFTEEDVWSSKPEAGRWALGRLARPDAVATALAHLSGAPEPAEADARAFVSAIARRLADANR